MKLHGAASAFGDRDRGPQIGVRQPLLVILRLQLSGDRGVCLRRWCSFSKDCSAGTSSSGSSNGIDRLPNSLRLLSRVRGGVQKAAKRAMLTQQDESPWARQDKGWCASRSSPPSNTEQELAALRPSLCSL